MNNKIQNKKANPQRDRMHEQWLREKARGFRPEPISSTERWQMEEDEALREKQYLESQRVLGLGIEREKREREEWEAQAPEREAKAEKEKEEIRHKILKITFKKIKDYFNEYRSYRAFPMFDQLEQIFVTNLDGNPLNAKVALREFAPDLYDSLKTSNSWDEDIQKIQNSMLEFTNVKTSTLINYNYRKALFAFGMEPTDEDEEPAPMAMRNPPRYIDIPGQGLTPYQVGNPNLPESAQTILFGELQDPTTRGARFEEKPMSKKVEYRESEIEDNYYIRQQIGKLYWIDNTLWQVMSYNDDSKMFKLSNGIENIFKPSRQLNNEFENGSMVMLDPEGSGRSNLYAKVYNNYEPGKKSSYFKLMEAGTGKKYHISTAFKA